MIHDEQAGIMMTKAKLIALLALCAFLSLASILVVYHTHQLPTEQERLIPLCNYEQIGKYNYTAILKPNIIYNQSTLKPGEGILYTRITEYINTTFSYTFKLSDLDRPANITIEYSINAYLEPPQWRKRINIAPQTTLNSIGTTAELSANYLVNITSFEETFSAIRSETGTYISQCNLTITPEIHTVASTDVGTIDKHFTPTLKITFNPGSPEGDIITIEGLNHTSPGAITQTKKIYQPWVMNQRYTSYTFSAITLTALAYTTWLFTKTRPVKLGEKKKTLEEIIAPFEEIVVEIAEKPSYEGQRVTMKTLEDLVELADGLGKPVFHSEGAPSSPGKEPTHTFYVLDGLVRYEYTITAPSIEEKAEPETAIEEENENTD